MRIRKWDRRKCAACGRNRVHFMPMKRADWICIGKLPERSAGVVACGQPRKSLG